VRRGVELRAVAPVDHDARAIGNEPPRDLLADAGSAAAHGGHAIFERMRFPFFRRFTG
jgi:hypothetical protein